MPFLVPLLALAAPAAAAAAVSWKPGFGRASLWNDGMAEVSVYEARDLRYGVPRSSRSVLIVVAEDLLPGRLVKADRPRQEPRTRRVLKLNHVRDIPTGVYSYQQMLSAFLEADRLEPVKLTMTSHEWCGNSFAEWRSDRAALSIRSYFQVPGDLDVALAPGDAVFYDALPLALRGLDFERTRSGTLRVVGSVFSSRPLPPSIEEARLDVARPAQSPPVYRVSLRRGTKTDTFDFETGFPHRLVRWDRSDGGSLERTLTRRSRYWEENAPGDERLLSPPATR
ncbi:MAG: hypothetical protein WEB59_00600 [Thermoanaerobaculia bacterium]